MKKQAAILMLACAFCVPRAALAKTTPRGTSGVINAPSGYVRMPGHVSAGMDWTKDDKTLRGNVSLPLGLEIAAESETWGHL